VHIIEKVVDAAAKNRSSGVLARELLWIRGGDEEHGTEISLILGVRV